ncbi:DUF5129 domain-containing protein [Arthrobacter psychrolactophilus]|nr:DUF5129 domain-containing protein [Arthrobacter psychrolactophilus]
MKKILGIVALTLLAILGVAPAAMAAPPTDIVVADAAGVLYQPQLLAALKEIDFREPTKVAVVTIEGENGTDQINSDVLELARAQHPEWLSADEQKWADGLFIFAVDPIARKVGTYMGEDRKVSLSKQEAIQESTKDLFREAQWTEGTIAGVKKAAKLINQPWYLSAGFIITSSIVGGLAVIGIGTRAGIRANNRRKAAEHLKNGDAGYSSVSLALDVTELNAKTIPGESSYGSLVLEKYRLFMTEYLQARELNEQSHAFSKKDLSTAGNVKVVKKYAELAAQLDTLDDVIGDTNTLLNRYAGWEGAWDRQVAPLRADLDQLPPLLEKSEAKGLPSTVALASLHAHLTQRLEQLGADFQSSRISPDAALDTLRGMNEELTEALKQHSTAMIDQFTKTKSEKATMEKAMGSTRQQDAYGRQGTILGSVYSWSMFYPVHSFNVGYASGRSEVSSDRSQASSSGSSSGYGSSGGSFSGSGSSSSF